MTSNARIRLTAWYMLVVALFVVLLGALVYGATARQLQSQADAGLERVGQRAAFDAIADVQAGRPAGSNNDIDAQAVAGAYQVIVSDQGQVHGPLAGLQLSWLPYSPAIRRVRLRGGVDLRTISLHGYRYRIYTSSIRLPTGDTAVIQVAQATAAQDQAVSNVGHVVVLGGLLALALGALGTWWLAGKSLRPLEEALEREHSFVGDASHELRTPLAVIRANAEFALMSHPEDEEVAAILAESERLADLVATLLALARSEHTAVHVEACDLAEITCDAVTTLMRLADQRELTVTVDSDPAPIAGSPEQLHQMIVILVDNAIRYSDPGGSINVTVKTNSKLATLTVTDSGIGIAAEDQPRIFERFYRADKARNRQAGGAGLGLALAADIISRHGGSVNVESAPGEGSTFMVMLPVR